MINPHEVVSHLTELRDGIDNGTRARDQQSRNECLRLGTLVTILEFAREDQRLADREDDRAQLNDVVIKEARVVLTAILEKRDQPPH